MFQGENTKRQDLGFVSNDTKDRGHPRKSVYGLGDSTGRVRPEEGRGDAPTTRAAQHSPWPPGLVEVGYSETLAQLQIDAK